MAPKGIPLFHDIISLDDSGYFAPQPTLHQPQTGQQSQAQTTLEEINLFWAELRRADKKMEAQAAKREAHIVHILMGYSSFMIILATANILSTAQGFPLQIFTAVSMLVSAAAITLSGFFLYQSLKDYRKLKQNLILKNMGGRKI